MSVPGPYSFGQRVGNLLLAYAYEKASNMRKVPPGFDGHSNADDRGIRTPKEAGYCPGLAY